MNDTTYDQLKKQILYVILENETITTKQLIELGLKRNDINKLMESSFLSRKERGIYEVTDLDAIFSFSISIKDKNIDGANKLLNMILARDPENKKIIKQLIINYLKISKIDLAYEQVKKLYELEKNGQYEKDILLVRYLLSLTKDDIIENINYHDVVLTPEESKTNGTNNGIRSNIFNHKLKQAKNVYDERIKNKEAVQFDYLMYVSLNKAMTHQKEIRNKIKDLFEKRDFEGAYNFYKQLELTQGLTSFETVIYNMLHDLLRVNPIVNNDTFESSDVLLLLANKNYNAARSRITDSNKILYILASAIFEKMDTYKKEVTVLEEVIKEEPEVGKTTREEPIKEEIVEEIPENEYSDKDIYELYTLIVKNIYNNEPEEAYNYLDAYLTKLDKTNYYRLVATIIGLGDTKLIEDLLMDLSNPNYKFDISIYAYLFYKYISIGSYDNAKNILNVIELYSDFDDISNNITTSLQYCMSLCTTKVEETPKVPENIEELEEIQPTKIVEVPFVEEEPIKEEVVEEVLVEVAQESNPETTISNDLQNELTKLFDEIVNDNNISLIGPYSKETRKEIYAFVEYYNQYINQNKDGYNILVLKLEDQNPARLVVKRYVDEYIDVVGLLKEMNNLKKQNRPEEAIELGKIILNIKLPRPNIYALLGILYLKTGNSNKAYNYLVTAQELSKRDKYKNMRGNKVYDFSDKIGRIEREYLSSHEDRKTYSSFQEKEFTVSSNYIYQIPNMVEMIDNVIEGITTPEEEKTSRNLSNETYGLLLIGLSRYYYANGNTKRGDAYLNSAIKVPKKTEQLQKEIVSTQKDKKFYKNRLDEYQRILKLN